MFKSDQSISTARSLIAAALWRRRHAVTAQNIAGRLIGDTISQVGDRPENPLIAPGPVLLRHPYNQFRDFFVDWRSTRASTRRDPLNSRATSPRYHARMVSGKAAVATSLRALRPDGQSRRASLARHPRAGGGAALARLGTEGARWPKVVPGWQLFSTRCRLQEEPRSHDPHDILCCNAICAIDG
jgi:hypothetical protein